jgi:hypothetical protein
VTTAVAAQGFSGWRREAAIRWAAKSMADVARVRALWALAEELESRASEFEAKKS